MKQKKISHMVMLGDSLTDRGTMNRRYLADLIPMAIIVGLAGHSPLGRFTNGYTWSDGIGSIFASEFIIKRLRENYKLNIADICDAILANDSRVMKLVNNCYHLQDDRSMQFNGRDFIRNYNEGGLSSHDYSWKPSISFERLFNRRVLSNLTAKRGQMLAYDAEHQLSLNHKLETLVIEWSGANDLITANERPSEVAVHLAIKSRMENLEILIKNNYRHFVLFNLPDLSLTPKYQNILGEKGNIERANARKYSLYFNQELAKESKKISILYPHCSVNVFDIETLFANIYNHPEKYRFDKDKLKQPFITSKDFILNKKISPTEGYMFWDDIHPTADMHCHLAQQFYQHVKRKYYFAEPQVDSVQEAELNISAQALRAAFITKYGERLNEDRNGFFGRWRCSNINYKTASLEEILHHGLERKDNRTRQVLTDLYWLNKEGRLNLNIPALKNAMSNLEADKKRMVPSNVI